MNKPLTCLILGVAVAIYFLAPQIGSTAGTQADRFQHPIRPPVGGTWAPLTNQPPKSGSHFFSSSEMFLLTDGSVLCVAADTSYNFNTSTWFSDPSVYKLTPDLNGSYANGIWTQVASMNHSRLYFGSAVLADGRVLVCGGEYADGSSLLAKPNNTVWSNACEIYDPVANTWTNIPGPGWAHIGDAPSVVLPKGDFLLGSDFDTRIATFNPITNAWGAAANIPSVDLSSDEEAWALLPNNRVMAVSCDHHPDTRYYDVAANAWVDAGNTPTDLVDPKTFELGPSMLMPDGNLFQMGATPFDCVYTPSTNTWADGPPVATLSGVGLCAPDAPAAMLPNGKILLSLTQYSAGTFGPRHSWMAEFDGTTMTVVTRPTNAINSYAYSGRFLVLPNGQVLFTSSGNSDSSNNTVFVYTPDGTYQAGWQPTIASVSGTLQEGSTNNGLSGTQLNGISQGSSYGDDSSNFTNYPIVRIQNGATGHVFYCRTHDHSTMEVQTGSAVVSTKFDVPIGIETGPSNLYVVANGIPSAPQAVNVAPDHVYLPNSYSLFRGVIVAGGLSSLFFGDSIVLDVLTGPTLNNTEAPVQVVITGTSPTLAPTSLAFTTTSRVNTPGTSQTISLWNYATGAYDVLDTRPISTSDLTVTVTAVGTLRNYVGASGAVQARVAYKQTSPTLIFRWMASLDLANWTIQ